MFPATAATQARQDGQLNKAIRAALRAWIRADTPDVVGVEKERLLSEARRLSGEAVAYGLLR